MLNHLKECDIDAVVAACGAAGAQSSDSTTLPDSVYSLIDALSREAQDELLALMWTGGPKNESSFEENLELAQKTADDNHAAHLAEQYARLPTYLQNGLQKLQNK
jgi:hypothetical protein